MHATLRESRILKLLAERQFVTFRELEGELEGSAATIRRDLERLASEGKIERVRGGAKVITADEPDRVGSELKLYGATFEENFAQNIQQKRTIGKAAAELCKPGEGITIDGGTTTLQMCP